MIAASRQAIEQINRELKKVVVPLVLGSSVS
jgi:hypothetical protein